ncbi:MAG: Protein archease [Candidatus Heimdallarchaeota archaeon LC_2]|nr:MAG: Protein archease [Candidatus Heimdallarchaeota archaeon LC_2]
MPYQYLEDEAISDIAFKAWGSSLSEIFTEAAKAVYTLLTNIEELTNEISHPIDIKANSIEQLLYKFLDEIVYLKDAELFFPKDVSINITKNEDNFVAKGQFTGCEFNYEIHTIGNDVKAITYHDFYLKEMENGWECYVLVDI